MKTHKTYLLLAAVLTFLFSLPPTHAQTNGDILDRVSKAVGVELSDEYRLKVKDFVANDTIMRTRSATQFTEMFLKEQMKEDWGMSKKHQYLFMWSSIYGAITKKFLYDWLDDEDEVRSNDYEKHLKTIVAFSENYSKEFKAYMEQKSAEYDRRSAEAKQRSAEAKQRSAEAKQRSAEAKQRSAEAIKETMKSDTLGVIEAAKYYNLCIKNPATNDKNEIEAVKNALKDIIDNCKKYSIDYKAILRKELGDEKKVKEMLKFYGIQ